MLNGHTILSQGSEVNVIALLNGILSQIDYHRHPIHDEAALRMCFQMFFQGAQLRTLIEHHNAWGRSDVEVETTERLVVFEFKVVEQVSEKNQALALAVKQM